MSCACNGPCSCDASIPVGPRGFPGPAGPPNNLTFSVTALPAGSPPTVTVTGVSPNQNVDLGIPSGLSPVFSVTVTTLNPGDPATASIDNTNPLAPILQLGIPPGNDGANGINPFTTLTASYVQPAIGSAVPVDVGTTAWMSVGAWVYILAGGWYIIQTINSATQVTLRNPGPADLVPTTGVPQNASVGVTVGTTGSDTQVLVSGRMGPAGAAGDPGPSPEINWIFSPPVSPPAPGGEFVFYADAAPPSRATLFVPYSWDGAAWNAGPNIAGAPGSQTFFGTADPNISSPSPSTIGDVYWRVAGSTLTSYQRTGPSTWTVQGTLSLLGTVTTDVTWTSAPGTYTIDLATFSYNITADKDIELDWDDTNYNGQGNWTVLITNTDASPIDLTFAAGMWSADPALSITPPVAIASGDVLVIQFVKVKTGISYCVTNLFIPAGI